MIKGTRIWGGSLNQGQAFGYLDGGRGLTAALMGSIGVAIFSIFLPDQVLGVFDFLEVLDSEVGINGFSLLSPSLSFSSGKEAPEGKSS